MEKFVTQFTMSGLKTNATVQVLEENQFGFVIHLTDAFEGGEESSGDEERDGIIVRNENGQWQLSGETRVILSDADISDLGQSIENSFLRK